MPAMDIGVLGRWLSSKDACTRGPARASGEAHTKVQIDGFRLVNSFWKLKRGPPWQQAFSTSHDDEFGTTACGRRQEVREIGNGWASASDRCALENGVSKCIVPPSGIASQCGKFLASAACLGGFLHSGDPIRDYFSN